jgi:hypothetical protein
VFLGARGHVDPASRRHRMHTATLVCHRGCRVMIDCGATWRGRLAEVGPHAVIITHAHPEPFDHATIRAQLGWCADEGVPRTIVTHGGSDIVGGDERRAAVLIRTLAPSMARRWRSPATGWRVVD